MGHLGIVGSNPLLPLVLPGSDRDSGRAGNVVGRKGDELRDHRHQNMTLFSPINRDGRENRAELQL